MFQDINKEYSKLFGKNKNNWNKKTGIECIEYRGLMKGMKYKPSSEDTIFPFTYQLYPSFVSRFLLRYG